MASTAFKPTTPLVYTATVIEVDPEAYTMRFFSKQKGITMPIEIPSMFTNSRGGNGGGMHIMPEVGAEVWVCETSDGTVVPLQYHGVIGDGTYSNNRPVGLPGDIVLSTTHGNSVKVLKGGSILTQASPVCSTTHDSLSDSIRHFSNSFYRYSVASKEEHTCDNTGNRDTQTSYQYYFNAEDEEPCAKVSIGSDYQSIYKIEIQDRSSDFSTMFTTDLFANGNAVVVGNDLHVDVDLCTVGAKANADFVVNSTQFLADLATLCTALQQIGTITPIAALVASGDVATVSAVGQITSATSDILGNISSGVYPTTKLKSE